MTIDFGELKIKDYTMRKYNFIGENCDGLRRGRSALTNLYGYVDNNIR